MKTPTLTVPRRQAAEIIGISPGTLRNWGSAQPARGPMPTKLGTSKQARAMYRLDEIERWQRDPAGYEKRRSSDHGRSR